MMYGRDASFSRQAIYGKRSASSSTQGKVHRKAPQISQKHGNGPFRRCLRCRWRKCVCHDCQGMICLRCSNAFQNLGPILSLKLESLLLWDEWYDVCASSTLQAMKEDPFQNHRRGQNSINYEQHLVELDLDMRATSPSTRAVLEIYVTDRHQKQKTVLSSFDTVVDGSTPAVGLEQSRRVAIDARLEHFPVYMGPDNDSSDSTSGATGARPDIKRPAINISQLDEFVRRGILGGVFSDKQQNASSEVDARIVEHTQLFVGYLVMLSNLSTTMIHESSLHAQWSKTSVAWNLIYGLAFRLQELFEHITDDCHTIRSEGGSHHRPSTLFNALETLFYVFHWSSHQSWHLSATDSGKSLASLKRKLDLTTRELINKVLYYECVCSGNFQTTLVRSRQTLVDFLRKQSSGKFLRFPRHCLIAIQPHAEYISPRYEYWPFPGTECTTQSVVGLCQAKPDNDLGGLSYGARSDCEELYQKSSVDHYGREINLQNMISGDLKKQERTKVGTRTASVVPAVLGGLDYQAELSFDAKAIFLQPPHRTDKSQYRGSGKLVPDADHLKPPTPALIHDSSNTTDSAGSSTNNFWDLPTLDNNDMSIYTMDTKRFEEDLRILDDHSEFAEFLEPL